MADPRTLDNDRFGYSVYALVAPASPEHVRMVADVREAIGMTRAAISAHVTVRGTFYGIESLDEMCGLLGDTASQQKPVQVVFSPGGWKYIAQDGGLHLGIMPCETTPDLLALHNAFDAVIRPRSENAYPDGYRAHMTLFQDCTDAQVEQAKSLVKSMDTGTGFKMESVELMGRVGPAFGGEWRLIETIPLTR